MKRTLVVAASCGLSMVACGGGAEAPKTASDEPKAANALKKGHDGGVSPEERAWMSQVEPVAGIERDTGSCVVASNWSAAESWAQAFRYPIAEAPAAGAELPKSRVETIAEAKGLSGKPARLVKQSADYPLAGKIVRRRFLFQERPDSKITGCVVYEGVADVGDDEHEANSPWLGLMDGEMIVYSTNQSDRPADQPPANALGGRRWQSAGVHLDWAFRDACVLVADMMSCLSMPDAAQLERAGKSLRLSTDTSFVSVVASPGGARPGPFLVSLRGGASGFVGEPAMHVLSSFSGRAMIAEIAREEGDSLTLKLDPALLSPFVDSGACITVQAPSRVEVSYDEYDEYDDEDAAWDEAEPADDNEEDAPDEAKPRGERVLTIGEATQRHWAESFLPDLANGGASTAIGELADEQPVQLFTVRELLGDGGAFVFVAKPNRVYGCALTFAGGSYRVEPRSFQRRGDWEFSFSLESSAPMTPTVESYVVCRVEDEAMGCALAPERWSLAPGVATGIGPGGESTDNEADRSARIEAMSDGFVWRPNDGGSELRVEIVPGEVRRVDRSAHAVKRITERATLKSP